MRLVLIPCVDISQILHHWLLPLQALSTSPGQDQRSLASKRFRDPHTSYKSCDWIFTNEEYRRFSDSKDPYLLWIKGPSGCGKSVLISSVVEKLHEDRLKDSPRILFFYCHRHPEPSSPVDILRSLLSQTLEWNSESVLELLKAFYLECPVLDEYGQNLNSRLCQLLRDIMLFGEERMTIVIDALDECESTRWLCEQLLDIMASSPAVTRPHLLVSSCYDGKDLFDRLSIVKTPGSAHYAQLDINPARTAEDLRMFVATRVEDASSPLRRKPQIVREEVIEKICKRADGLFLYASLVLDELKGDRIASTAAINATIKHLPIGLHEMYNRSLDLPLRSIKGKEAFAWIYASFRSLSWAELSSALAIIDGSYLEEELITDNCELFVQHSCGQLLEVFGESGDQVRFIHPSVRDFLGQSGSLPKGFDITRAQDLVTSKLLQFLQYEDTPDYPPIPGIDVQAFYEQYSVLPGRGLYQYAVFNWFKHLKKCDKGPNEELEMLVNTFLASDSCIRWLKSIMAISDYAKDEQIDLSLTRDVIDSLAAWSKGKTWATGSHCKDFLPQWISDFHELMLDWGQTLESHPFWIHFIHHQLLSRENRFRTSLGMHSGQKVLQLQHAHVPAKMIARLSWVDSCFLTDVRHDLAYTYNSPLIRCYHMPTDLLIADFEIDSTLHRLDLAGPDTRLSVRKGRLSPDQRFLAIMFEITNTVDSDQANIKNNIRAGLQLTVHGETLKMAWKLESEDRSDQTAKVAQSVGVENTTFCICLLQLHHERASKKRFFGIAEWAETTLINTSNQRLRGRLDDSDCLSFSPDSSTLAIPEGTIDLRTGELEKWSFMGDAKVVSGKPSADFEVLATVKERSTLQLRYLRTGEVRHEFKLEGIIHILSISDRGRFILLLKTQSYHPKGQRTKRSDSYAPKQRGTIGIYDLSRDHWVPLLFLDPPLSQKHAPWKLWELSFEPIFSSELAASQTKHALAVAVSPGWVLAEGVQGWEYLNIQAGDSEPRLLIFEAEMMADGFGQHPILKHGVALKFHRSVRTYLHHVCFMTDWILEPTVPILTLGLLLSRLFQRS